MSKAMLKIGCKQRFDMGSCTDFALPWTSAITRGQAEASLMLSLQSHNRPSDSKPNTWPGSQPDQVSRNFPGDLQMATDAGPKYNWHRQQTWKTRSTQSFPLVEVRMMFLCIPDWKNIPESWSWYKFKQLWKELGSNLQTWLQGLLSNQTMKSVKSNRIIFRVTWRYLPSWGYSYLILPKIIFDMK